MKLRFLFFDSRRRGLDGCKGWSRQKEEILEAELISPLSLSSEQWFSQNLPLFATQWHVVLAVKQSMRGRRDIGR
jgi:hypothetical protein